MIYYIYKTQRRTRLLKGEYLSEIVSEDDIKEGALNLIYAPCGSGKTTYALNDLSLYSFANYGNVPLYLIDTVNGKEQLITQRTNRN